MDRWDLGELEQAARDAAAVRRHTRDFRARLRDAMARGDRIRLAGGSIRIVGLVIEVGDDLVSLRADDGARVDVHIGREPQLLLGIVEAAAAPGRTPPLPSGGFRGRLLAAEASGAQYTLTVHGEEDSLYGRIEVGRDHADVIGDAGAATVVPSAMIVAIRRVASAP